VRTIDRRTNQVTITVPQLHKVRIYAEAYGSGGYQDRFKALLEAAYRVRPESRPAPATV
jgi:hypothetical protein